MSGEETGVRAAALRAAMTAAEVPYTVVTALRNALFDAGVRKPARLPRPVISVGNITSGGTGKTPVVRWLAERLRSRGKTAAVLSRGYKAEPGQLGDEQRMLADLLNRPGEPPVIIRADPSRQRAGEEILRDQSHVDIFLLDDGFQHRQLARDFDLVLISAVEPFGFGHVLPRGMLREPLRGLSRASALLLTRCDQANEAQLDEIRRTLRKYIRDDVRIYESVHAHSGFRSTSGSETLERQRWFAFCGLGDPQSFVRQLDATGAPQAGHRFFADHHAYTDADVAAVTAEAASAGADVLITTEKDWIKLAALAATGQAELPIWRVDVEVRFRGEDEARLLGEIERTVLRQG